MSQYSQQTKTVCTDTNDPTCKANQAQYDSLNALDAQTKADGQYDAPPSPSPTQAQQLTVISGFTTMQSTYTGLFAAGILLILYGLLARGPRRGK
jgi:hypothetical protein